MKICELFRKSNLWRNITQKKAVLNRSPPALQLKDSNFSKEYISVFCVILTKPSNSSPIQHQSPGL